MTSPTASVSSWRRSRATPFGWPSGTVSRRRRCSPCTPPSSPTPGRPDRMPYRLLWRYLAPYRARYAWGLAFLVVANALSLLIPWMVKSAIEALSARGPTEAPIGRYVILILILAAPYPLLVMLATRFNERVHVQSQAVQEQLSVMAAKVQENLSGMSVVRAYTLEPREMAAFGRLNAEYLDRSLALGRVQAQFAPLMGLVAGIGTLVILWVGGTAVSEGGLTLGAFVAFDGSPAH